MLYIGLVYNRFTLSIALVNGIHWTGIQQIHILQCKISTNSFKGDRLPWGGSTNGSSKRRWENSQCRSENTCERDLLPTVFRNASWPLRRPWVGSLSYWGASVVQHHNRGVFFTGSFNECATIWENLFSHDGWYHLYMLFFQIFASIANFLHAKRNDYTQL